MKHARVTEDVLAEESGKTVRTIRRHAEHGTIMRGPDGLYDRALALSQIAAATNGSKGRPRKPADGESARVDWNERLKKEQARKARLERLEIQGKLVRRSAVEAAWAEQATMVRDQLMQLGPRMADRLASETDPRVCSQLVSDEVRTALRALSEVE